MESDNSGAPEACSTERRHAARPHVATLIWVYSLGLFGAFVLLTGVLFSEPIAEFMPRLSVVATCILTPVVMLIAGFRLYWLLVGRPRFRSKTVVLAFVVILPLFGWIGARFHRALQQQQAVQQLQAMGAGIYYANMLEPPGPGEYMPVFRTPPGPAGLRRIFGEMFFGVVSSVDLKNVEDIDAAMPPLSLLRSARFVRLDESKISDSHLAQLEGLSSLECLDLRDTQVTDGAIVHLKKLTTLKELYLGSTQLTREGADELARALPQCEVFWSPAVVHGESIPHD
ncbi:MAG: hypothetical protein JXB62_22740 [Pirellulales bacterium]|nr:hypothetical protein [Pirellulales bacterium]